MAKVVIIVTKLGGELLEKVVVDSPSTPTPEVLGRLIVNGDTPRDAEYED